MHAEGWGRERSDREKERGCAVGKQKMEKTEKISRCEKFAATGGRRRKTERGTKHGNEEEKGGWGRKEAERQNRE